MLHFVMITMFNVSILFQRVTGHLYITMQVVEITKGSKVKYELDKKTGLIKVCPQSCVHLDHQFLSQELYDLISISCNCAMNESHHPSSIWTFVTVHALILSGLLSLPLMKCESLFCTFILTSYYNNVNWSL